MKDLGHQAWSPDIILRALEIQERILSKRKVQKDLVWVRGIERLIFVEYLSAGPLFSCLILGMTFHIGDYQCIL